MKGKGSEYKLAGMSLIVSEQADSEKKILIDFHIITLIVYNQP